MKAMLALCLLLMLWCLPALAHDPGYSTATVQRDGSRLRVELRTAPKVLYDAAAVEASQGLVQREIADLTDAAVRLATGDDALLPDFVRLSLEDDRTALLQTDFATPARSEISVSFPLLGRLPPGHPLYLTVVQDGVSTRHVLLASSNNVALGAPAPSAWAVFSGYVAHGAHHIWIGYDHILFLITLILTAGLVRRNRRWRLAGGSAVAIRDTAVIVTAFTLAHSITLGLSATGVIALPARPVEVVIALSVLVAALSNLLTRDAVPRGVYAFAFGLIHGLGFANVLTEVGLPPDVLATGLIGFNIGVELGQLLIVALVLPLLILLRRSHAMRQWMVTAGSTTIAFCALFFLGSALW